jgi:hypothetical protein
MSVLTRSIPLVALALGLGAAQLPAQTKKVTWSIGAQGGLLNFRTPAQTRGSIPMGGVHMLVMAKRTGLLLSAEHGFEENQAGGLDFFTEDSTGAVIASGGVPYTFDGVRKYSAMLVLFPLRSANLRPYLGVGVGILHTTGNSPDDAGVSAAASTGFGSGLAGLELSVGGVSVFGQYQATTTGAFFQERFADGENTTTVFGRGFSGPTHTFAAGIRFSLGSGRDDFTGGGY